MIPRFFEEQVFFSTLRIDAIDPSTGRSSIGTGFLVEEPLPGSPDHSVIVLVTCRHVLFDGHGLLTLRFHRRSAPESLEPALGQQVVFGPATHDQAYFGHPNPDMDIAAVNVSDILSQNPLIYFRHLSRHNWANFSDERLVPTREVIFVGYPLGLFDQANNLPILRAGRIASHPRVDFDGRPEFLIDAQVFPGSSGSPVLVALDTGYHLAGVVGRSHFHKSPVESAEVAVTGVSRQFIGLGVVYKPSAVLELLELIAQRASPPAAQPTQ